MSYTSRIASSARADEAAAEEQFLEKTPWANPQHPMHQQILIGDRSDHDSTRASTATPSNRVTDLQQDAGGSAATIGINSDPPSGLAQSQVDTIVNGSSPLGQMKRSDSAKTDQELQSKDDDTNSTDHMTNPAAYTYNGTPASTSNAWAENGFHEKPEGTSLDASALNQPFETSAPPSNPTSEIYVSGLSFAPRLNAGFGSPDPEEQDSGDLEDEDDSAEEQERYQSPTLDAATDSGTADRGFTPTPPAHEGLTVDMGVAQSFGVR